MININEDQLYRNVIIKMFDENEIFINKNDDFIKILELKIN